MRMLQPSTTMLAGLRSLGVQSSLMEYLQACVPILSVASQIKYVVGRISAADLIIARIDNAKGPFDGSQDPSI